MESEIKQYLKENNIIPFSVTYTKILGDLNTGLLCISFYNKEDYSKFLELINYEHKCDKRGIILFSKSYTTFITGLQLYDITKTIGL